MDEPNSQPTRCPCGFFGSPQTLGLCSKCFREREQNQNQAAADISRPLSSSSSSNTDQSRLSMSSGTDQSRLSMSSGTDQSRLSMSSGTDQSRTVSTGTNTLTVEITPHRSSMPHRPDTPHRSNTSMYHPDTPCASELHGVNANSVCSESLAGPGSSGNTVNSLAASPLNCTTDRRGQKRKHLEVAAGTSVDELASPVKRERGSASNRHCGLCKCRLELAVREIGKCRCGSVFCLLHRLPEQHNCTFDHKEDGRREARAKMVPARKHVGTTLKRLDSDS